MTYSTIIFDLDGTLLDTLTDIAESINLVLINYGFPSHSNESYKLFLGNGLYNLITKSVPENTAKSVIQDCSEIFKKIYSDNWKNNCCPYDGINTMLANLSDQGIKLAVLSNKPHAFTCLFVNEFFPKDMFRAVFGQRDGVEKKPHPTGALDIARILQSRPENTLFVGDSDVDIQTGRAAGMGTVGVSWGYRSVEELIENRAEIIVNRPSEIVKHVLSAT